MVRHYVRARVPGGIRRVDMPNREFHRLYEKAVPHQPRWAQRRLHKRVRLYRPRTKPLPEKPPVPEKVLWRKVTVYYEGTARNSYHIDCGVVGRTDLFTWRELEEKLRKNVLKAVEWYDAWSTIEGALGLSPEKAEISEEELWMLMKEKGIIRLGRAEEEDGVEEEWCEVWRV